MSLLAIDRRPEALQWGQKRQTKLLPSQTLQTRRQQSLPHMMNRSTSHSSSSTRAGTLVPHITRETLTEIRPTLLTFKKHKRHSLSRLLGPQSSLISPRKCKRLARVCIQWLWNICSCLKERSISSRESRLPRMFKINGSPHKTSLTIIATCMASQSKRLRKPNSAYTGYRIWLSRRSLNNRPQELQKWS